ncbi:MAG TPA: proton-conducting transporter membrane subunit, partial [Nitrosomonas sp.]|nr:proton-conducting transporter membrane subunit [Nitrosomonas sp.]
ILSREGFEAENLSDYKGLNQRNPWLALIMMFLMLSMAGIPPMIGFYAKLSVLQAVVNAGFVWLAITAVVLSLIGAFYYLRIIKLMYFEAPEHDTPVLPSFDAKILISVNGLAVLIAGIFPQALMGLSLQAIQTSM